MDFNLFFFNRCFDKNRLKALISWCLVYKGENATLEVVEDLKEFGFRYATQAGISIGLNDLKTPPSKSFLVSQAEKNMRLTEQEFLGGRITATEKSQRVVDTWHRTSETLKQEVVDHFQFTESLNPVYVMALSGARGNFSQVRQLVGMRGLMADPQGLIISFPIRSNFREGLTLTEYFISCYGARKGLVDTALRTADTGYLTRRLVDVSHHVVVKKATCKTQNGIILTELRSNNKSILSLKQRLVGRVLAATISLNPQSSLDRALAERDQEISVDLAEKIAALREHVLVRSPLTCSLRFDICQLCYGWSLSQGKLVTLGEAVGIIAAQSIGEPGTQLTMRTFHTGGVFSGDLLEEIVSPDSGYITFPNPLQGLLIRTPHGRIAFLTKTCGSLVLLITSSSAEGSNETNSMDATSTILRDKLDHTSLITKSGLTPAIFQSKRKEKSNVQPPKKREILLEPSTVLFVRQGEKVLKGQLLAEFSAVDEEQNERIQSKQILFAELSGQVFVESLIEKTHKKVKTGYQRKLSKTLGFVWIFSGKEFLKENNLAFYRRNGHLVDIESIAFRVYETKDRNHFVTKRSLIPRIKGLESLYLPTDRKDDRRYRKNSNVLRSLNNNVATLLNTFVPIQVFRINTVFAKANYNNNYGYALSFFPLNSSHSLYMKDWLGTKSVDQEKGLESKNFCLIAIKAVRPERNVDKLFFPQNMFSALSLEDFGYNQKLYKSSRGTYSEDPATVAQLYKNWTTKVNLFTSGKVLPELSKRVDNLYSDKPQIKELPKNQRSKNKYPFTKPSAEQPPSSLKSKISTKHSLNKQKISKFLLLWFIGRSSLLSGGSLEFDALYSERDKKRGHSFWLPQENYQVRSLFQPFNNYLTSRVDSYLTHKRQSNSLDLQKISKKPLLKRSLLKGIKGGDLLPCFQPVSKRFDSNKQLSVTKHIDSPSRKSLLKYQELSLLEYALFGISPVTLALCCETVSVPTNLDAPAFGFLKGRENFYSQRVYPLSLEDKESLVESLDNSKISNGRGIRNERVADRYRVLKSNTNLSQKEIDSISFSDKAKEWLSIVGFWGNKRIPLGSALNLQGNLVTLFSRYSGWLTTYSVPIGENLGERDRPRFTTLSEKVFSDHFLKFEISIQEEKKDKRAALNLWTNLGFVRDMKSEISKIALGCNAPKTKGRSISLKSLVSTNNKLLIRYVTSNPSAQRHEAFLKASFQTLGYFLAEREDKNRISGKQSQSVEELVITDKKPDLYVPVFSLESQRLALLNLLPSSVFTRMKWKKSKRRSQNYCLKVKPGWLYLSKYLLAKGSAKTRNSSKIVIDDISFGQVKTNVEHVRFHDFPFHLPFKRSSAVSVSLDIQSTSLGSLLKSPIQSPRKSSSNLRELAPEKGVKNKIVLSPLKSKRELVCTSLYDTWEKLCKESNTKSGKNTTLLCSEIVNTSRISNSSENKSPYLGSSNISHKSTESLEKKRSVNQKTVKEKEGSFLKNRENRALVVALRKRTKQGIVGQLTSKKQRLPNYISIKKKLGKQTKSFESGLDQSVLLLLRQLLWTDSESFPINENWEFTPQQFTELGWLREYRVSTALITNPTGRYSSSCLSASKLEKVSSFCLTFFICRLLSPQHREMCSFEIDQVFFSASMKQKKQKKKLAKDFITEPEKTVKTVIKGSLSTVPRLTRFQTAFLFQKIYEKNLLNVSNCKKTLYDTKIDFIEGTDRRNASSLNYNNQQEIVPLYTIAPEARFNISQSLALGTGMGEVFSLAPFHFTRFAVNLTSSFVRSLAVSETYPLKTQMLDLATNKNSINVVPSDSFSQKKESTDLKRSSKNSVTAPASPSFDSNLDQAKREKRETKPLSIQDTSLENRGYRDYTIPFKGEVVNDPLGDMLLLNSDQISFFARGQTIQVVPGQLVRSGKEIATEYNSTGNPLAYSAQQDSIPASRLSNTRVSQGFEDKDIRLAVDRSGQVLKIEKNQITLRKAQAVLFYSQAVSHVSHGQWVANGSPVLTLTHQTLVTGDIVQGIPKIEQFFEASATKQGIPLADNLHKRLQTIFQEHRRDLPRPQAVRKSLEDIQKVLVEGIQRVYLSQGVLIADKHLEVVVRQMTSKGRIIQSGDTGLFHGEFIPIRRIEGVNLVTPGKKALYIPAVAGLTRTSLDSDSFISAASFQETTRVLTRDVISGRTDFLRGLKEKVILGDLISAGTGLENYLMYDLILARTPLKSLISKKKIGRRKTTL